MLAYLPAFKDKIFMLPGEKVSGNLPKVLRDVSQNLQERSGETWAIL